MSKPQFVYVTYIASTPEKVFDALTDSALTKLYWYRHVNHSEDWKPGSRWEHRDCDNPSKVDVVGKVVERDRPKRMVWSWSAPGDENNAEQTSRVTYEIEQCEGSVKLTVTHADLAVGSKMLQAVTHGWPMVLSSLKSLLERGEALAVSAARCEP